MRKKTPTREDVEDWLDVKGGSLSEVAVGVHRALQGRHVGVTHVQKDGDLCTDVLTRAPESEQLMGTQGVEVIQVKWTNRHVSKSSVEDFAEAQEKTSQVDTWTLFTHSRVSKSAENAIDDVVVEEYSKSVSELVLESLKLNGRDAGTFFERYDDPFEMERIERIGGEDVDQLLTPNEAKKPLRRESRSQRWVAHIGKKEAGNVFRIVPLDGQQREVKDVEPVTEKVTSGGKVILGESEREEFLTAWGKRIHGGSPRNILATREEVEVNGWP